MTGLFDPYAQRRQQARERYDRMIEIVGTYLAEAVHAPVSVLHVDCIDLFEEHLVARVLDIELARVVLDGCAETQEGALLDAARRLAPRAAEAWWSRPAEPFGDNIHLGEE